MTECREVFEQFAEDIRYATKLYSDSDTNQWLRADVVESVTEALNKVDRLLVPEDDRSMGNSRIGFFNWRLRQTEARANIGVISGNYIGPSEANKAFLAKRFSSWGW